MSRSAIWAAVLLTASAAGMAHAEVPQRPIGTKVRIDEPVTQQHNSNIIYMNPCWGGCTVTPGPNSSVNNTSPIIGGTRNLSQFNAGMSAWNAVVDCVAQMYEPFNIVVTDDDPSPSPHYEAMVAGTPQQLGEPSGVGGVSPYTCGVINNAITFSFANIYGGDVQAICEVVAQETAHAFGLDHEYHCPDNMTYLYGCGDKAFTDYDARCGEGSARNCCTSSGPSTQNSYQRILDIFGPSDPTPPTVTITDPDEDEQVSPGYPVRANVTDNVDVVRVELWVNNQRAQILMSPPWAFNAPNNLLDGVHTVEVLAYDNQGTEGSATVHVVQGEPCSSSDDCGSATLACVDGGCVPGQGTTGGGLGDTCETANDCISGLCVFDGDERYCTWPCDSSCNDGFGCQDGYCTRGAENASSGGCQTDGGRGPLWLGLALVALLVAVRRRPRG
jgi:MYXO-CTERM domain-containing protein